MFDGALDPASGPASGPAFETGWTAVDASAVSGSGPAPGAGHDVLADLEAAIDKAVASEVPLDPVRLWQLAERVEALKVRAAHAYDQSEDWRAEGFLTAAAALRARCRVEHGHARQALVLGAGLAHLPHVAVAFASGTISRHHVAAIADACTPERADALHEVEEQLVEVARRVRPRELRSVVRRFCDALDGDGGAAADNAQYERRYLHVSPTIDGMVMIDGQLDAASGEAVITCLQARMDADRQPGDTRSRPQQRADALVALCEGALAGGMSGAGSRRVRSHVSVIVDLEVLSNGRGSAAGAAGALAPDVGPTVDWAARVRGEAAHVGPLSAATLEWMSCDCAVSRVVTAGRSEVLDVGRATRVVSPALWKALVVRDGRCQAPGCDRPPGWCDAHHVVHWSQGGSTSLANLVLLCRRHHRAAHGSERERARGPTAAAAA